MIFSLLIYLSALNQEQKNNLRFTFLNKLEISMYSTLPYSNDGNFNLYEGNELKFDPISVTCNRHKLFVSTGIFFADKFKNKSEPEMLYFYFPLYLNYSIFSKNQKWFGTLTYGMPLYLNEDSKIINYSLWENYRNVTNDNYNLFPRRLKVNSISEIRGGYYFSNHFGVNLGVKLYNVKTTKLDENEQFTKTQNKPFFFFTIGFEYRFKTL